MRCKYQSQSEYTSTGRKLSKSYDCWVFSIKDNSLSNLSQHLIDSTDASRLTLWPEVCNQNGCCRTKRSCCFSSSISLYLPQKFECNAESLANLDHHTSADDAVRNIRIPTLMWLAEARVSRRDETLEIPSSALDSHANGITTILRSEKKSINRYRPFQCALFIHPLGV